MRFRELDDNGIKYTKVKDINKILEKNNLHWLIDSEIEEASIEVKNQTLIWNSGIFFAGNWHYGIFRNGEFYGVWENGIFEGGVFKGVFKSGIKS